MLNETLCAIKNTRQSVNVPRAKREDTSVATACSEGRRTHKKNSRELELESNTDKKKKKKKTCTGEYYAGACIVGYTSICPGVRGYQTRSFWSNSDMYPGTQIKYIHCSSMYPGTLRV